MISRFCGADGTQLLGEALHIQGLVAGNDTLTERLAAEAEVLEYGAGRRSSKEIKGQSPKLPWEAPNPDKRQDVLHSQL